MPVPGDIVYVRILEDEKTIVDRTEPRSFTLERRTVDGRSKTMAANVDTFVTVTALADPPPRLITLDQLLAFAELQEIEAASSSRNPTWPPAMKPHGCLALYEMLGYAVIVINPKIGINVD